MTRGIHHIAFGTRDSRATYDFYHTRLGMPLVHTENHRHGKGYFRHYFFSMGGDQYLGFFEVNGVGEKPDYGTRISSDLGLPPWVNHVAFNVADEAGYQALKDRLKEHGVRPVGEEDHGWCKSVYLLDPNGIMVEFSYSHRPERFGQSEDEAYRLLFDTPPEAFGEDSRKEASR